MFDTYIAVDWSAKNKPGSRKPQEDAIWVAVKQKSIRTYYFRTRHNFKKFITRFLKKDRGRVLIGFDFCLGFPSGFAELIGKSDWKGVWHEIDRVIDDNHDNSNNRFEGAARLNSARGPFYGRPDSKDYKSLPKYSPRFPFKGINKVRKTEIGLGVQPVWKLLGHGSVGSQSLLGIKMLKQLRFDILRDIRVWPFEKTANSKIVMAEIWPGIIKDRIKNYDIKDKKQVIESVKFMEKIEVKDFKGLSGEEGWILGA
ncbi:MAG: hypothetical protein ABEI74_01955 [Candidatus Pacearchaeota archaeon]